MIKVIEQTFICLTSHELKSRYCSPRAAAIFFWRSSTPKRGDNRGKVSWKTEQCQREILIFFFPSIFWVFYFSIFIRWSWILYEIPAIWYEQPKLHLDCKQGHWATKWGDMPNKLQTNDSAAMKTSCEYQRVIASRD